MHATKQHCSESCGSALSSHSHAMAVLCWADALQCLFLHSRLLSPHPWLPTRFTATPSQGGARKHEQTSARATDTPSAATSVTAATATCSGRQGRAALLGPALLAFASCSWYIACTHACMHAPRICAAIAWRPVARKREGGGRSGCLPACMHVPLCVPPQSSFFLLLNILLVFVSIRLVLFHSCVCDSTQPHSKDALDVQGPPPAAAAAGKPLQGPQCRCQSRFH